jgi:hypothetical protein
MTDITNLVLSRTQPLREEIDKLKYESRKLREDLDCRAIWAPQLG